MKKFFSLKNNFNISYTIALLVIFSSIFVPNILDTTLIIIAICISWIPEIYQAYLTYKESKKIITLIKPVLGVIFIIWLITYPSI